jgi:lipooligosaccharide transport system permease protein
MAATPLTSGDIASGLTVWHATRTAIGVAGVAAVLVLFDDTRSWGLMIAVPVAVLTGARVRAADHRLVVDAVRGGSFPTIIRFGLLPMFLFGARSSRSSSFPDGCNQLRT